MSHVRTSAALLLAAMAIACDHVAPRPIEQVEIRPPSAAVEDAGPAAIPIARPDEPAKDAVDGGPARCDVVIGALLAADVFTGVPDSPAREETLRHLPPDTRRAWAGRDHARVYLQCRFAVTMNGHAYTYKHVLGTGFRADPTLEPKRCSELETQRAVAQRVREVTKQCADPHAGAYGGYDLVPAQ